MTRAMMANDRAITKASVNGQEAREFVMRIACPTCGVSVGQPCRDKKLRPLQGSHRLRIVAMGNACRDEARKAGY